MLEKSGVTNIGWYSFNLKTRKLESRSITYPNLFNLKDALPKKFSEFNLEFIHPADHDKCVLREKKFLYGDKREFILLYRIQSGKEWNWYLSFTQKIKANGGVEKDNIWGLTIDLRELVKEEELIISNIKTLKQLFISETNSNLSKREKEILPLIMQGNSYTKIAEILSISPHTVIKHRKNILQKTGCKNIKELICYCYEHDSERTNNKPSNT